jgi:hypothetical protein
MTRSSIVAATLLTLALGMGSAFAQTPPKTDQPAAAPAGTMDKKAVAKSCSDQATAKGLHGKERKKFRSACKHNGGKAPE